MALAVLVTVRYCTVLYCTVLYCTDQTGSLLKELAGGYGPTAYSGFQTSTLLHTVRYCTVNYCTVLYCTVLYCTVRYCTVLYCTDQTGLLLKELAGGYDPTAYSTRRLGNSQPPALRRKSGY